MSWNINYDWNDFVYHSDENKSTQKIMLIYFNFTFNHEQNKIKDTAWDFVKHENWKVFQKLFNER